MAIPHWNHPTPLWPGDAVAAIAVCDGSYLLQRRDDLPQIFFPDCWGCFGGAIDVGENATAAIVREMAEETGLQLLAEAFRPFTTQTFDFGFSGGRAIHRTYYLIELTPDQVARVCLGEGRDFGLFTPGQTFADLNLTPYDSFALWMHAAAGRFCWKESP